MYLLKSNFFRFPILFSLLLFVACDYRPMPLPELIEQVDQEELDAFKIEVIEESDLALNDEGLSVLDAMFDQSMLQDAEVTPQFEQELNRALTYDEPSCLGSWMCRNSEGCVNGVCGVCLQKSDCPEGLVCSFDNNDEGSDFGHCVSCNSQESDLHCGEGEICHAGRCFAEELSLISLELSETHLALLKRRRYEFGLEFPCRVHIASIDLESLEATFESEEGESEAGESTSNEAEEDGLVQNEQAQLHSCKLRVHGGSSRDLYKLSWRIILDEAIEGFNWNDKHIILRAEYNDLSLMRNILSYELFRDWTNLPVPRWQHVWLNINGEHEGLYLTVERYTDRSIERYGKASQLPRFEADPNPDSNLGLQVGVSALIPLPSIQTYWQAYELKGGASYQSLINLIENIIGGESRLAWSETQALLLAQNIKWGDYLRYLSVMTLIQNLDHIRKNFIITRQLDSFGQARWEVYPWDLDLSWGCLFNDTTGLSLCDQYRFDIPLFFGTQPEGAPFSYPTDGVYNGLIERSLGVPLARQQYEQLLCQLSAPLINNPNLKRIFEWREALRGYLRPWIEVDETQRHEQSGDFDAAVDQLLTYWEDRSAFIREQIECPF